VDDLDLILDLVWIDDKPDVEEELDDVGFSCLLC
jgi:hypothetical protein